MFISLPAQAVALDVSIANTVIDSIGKTANIILPMAIKWLSAFLMLQFIWTNFGLLKGGDDIAVVWAKFLGALLWGFICFILIESGPDFISNVGNGIFNKFASDMPNPGGVIASTIALTTVIMTAAVATNYLNDAVSTVLIYVMFIVFIVGMYMAIKVLMIELELGIIVLLSPLSFALLGLNALKDQGIAPFKSLLSLVYRIILMGIIYSAFGNVFDVAGDNFANIEWTSPDGWAGSIAIILASVCAFPILAFLLYKSDSIAANMAGGTSSMSAGDTAGAAAAGGAAGALAGHVANAATSKIPLMSDVISNLMSGKGGAQNASFGGGIGGRETTGPAPVRSNPSASLATPPKRPDAGKIDAPQPPPPDSDSSNNASEAAPAQSISSNPVPPGSGADNVGSAGICGSESPLEKRIGDLRFNE
jgi:type IV secretion system protein TrbL